MIKINKNHRYVAHEVLITSIRLNLKRYWHTFLVCFLIQLIFLLFIIISRLTSILDHIVPYSNKKISFGALINYTVNLSFFGKEVTIPNEFYPLISQTKLRKHLMNGMKINRETYKKIFDAVTNEQLKYFFVDLKKPFRWSFLVWIVGGIYLFVSRKASKQFYKSDIIRGSVLKEKSHFESSLKDIAFKELNDDKDLLRQIIDPSEISIENLNLKISNFIWPRSYETKHFLILGSTGSGKSVLLNQMISQLLKRQKLLKNKLLIYDLKGEFISKHYDANRKDAIYYPFDNRTIKWSLFNEIRDYVDFDTISSSIFQEPPDAKDQYWYNCAKECFRAGLIVLYKKNKKKNVQIVNFFNQTVHKIVKDFYNFLPQNEQGAIKHLDKSDTPAAASIVSILQERISFMRYIMDTDGNFSFRDWICSDSPVGNIFLLNLKKNEQIFKPLMTLIIDISIREVLSLPECRSKNIPKVSFIIDEFGSLSKLMSIISFLECARSLGGSLVLANQELGTVTATYGENIKSSFFNNFNTLAVLRLNDPSTSRFISESIGEQEILKKVDSHQMSPSDIGDRFTISQNEKIEKVVLPSELQNLKDFCGYLKVAGHGICPIEIEKVFYKKNNPEFVERPFDVNKMIYSQKELDDQVSYYEEAELFDEPIPPGKALSGKQKKLLDLQHRKNIEALNEEHKEVDDNEGLSF